MSKLGIVVCAAAAAFIASAMAASLERFEVTEANDHIDNATKIIRLSTSTIHSEIYAMSPDHNIVNIYKDVIQGFGNNITKDYEDAKKTIEILFNNTLGGFNETNCREYLNVYKRQVVSVLDFLDSLYLQAFENATAPVTGKLEADFQAIRDLDGLKARAKTCSGVQCEIISLSAILTKSEFETRTEKVFQIYKNWFAEPTPREIVLNAPNYKKLLEIQRDVFNKTQACLEAPHVETS